MKARLPHRGALGAAIVAALVLGVQLGAGTDARNDAPPAPVPSGFLWGVATAGAQWEGGDTTSNWAAWAAAGHVREPAGRAADGWHRYEADLDLAEGLGLNAFRLSIEWSRIEPAPGRIDRDAVEHYRKVLKAIRARGMEPVVTLVHYAYPAWLDRWAPPGETAWETQAAVDRYVRFVGLVAREYGSDIKYYLTFNEPTVMVEAGYLGGMWPPGKKDLGAFLRASARLIEAHARAYDVIHAADPEALVSFNNYAAAYQIGLDPARDAVRAPGDDWFLQAFANAVGPRKLDFVAVDYYKRLSIPFNLIPPSPSQWVVYPEGVEAVLARYHKVFGLPILIAENGFATDNGKPRQDGWTRERYLVRHVAAVQRAIAQGIPVLGYIYWTLTDNWEWGSFDDRFGLYGVACRQGDMTRRPTAAAALYRDLVRAGGVTPERLVVR